MSPSSTVGYWMSPNFPFLPQPRDYVDESWDASERESVMRYLQSGRTQYVHMRPQKCGICGGSFGTNDLTDGTWSWPEDLLHYVVTHHVKPDQAFVDWVLERKSDAGDS